MKRTNVVLDEKLLKDCIKATGIKTQKALIDHAYFPEEIFIWQNTNLSILAK
jgi:hypothetical protein